MQLGPGVVAEEMASHADHAAAAGAQHFLIGIGLILNEPFQGPAALQC